MSVLSKREIWISITALCGLLVIFEYFFPLQAARDLSILIQGWAVVIAGFAVGIGLINLTIIHVRRFARKEANWLLSAWLVFIMALVIVIGLTLTPSSPAYSWLFDNVYAVVGPTMWSLLGFYIATAAFRSLRARTLEAGLLLISAVLLMLVQAPIGGIMPYVPTIAFWIRDVPNTAGMRAIILGTAIGAIGLGIRTLLGRERGYSA